jgi:hypothetical protein
VNAQKKSSLSTKETKGIDLRIFQVIKKSEISENAKLCAKGRKIGSYYVQSRIHNLHVRDPLDWTDSHLREKNVMQEI